MKRKFNFNDILTLSTAYHAFNRVTVQNVKGWLYKFDKLTINEIEHIKSFKNTKVFNTQAQYTPEIKGVAVFVGDKCF